MIEIIGSTESPEYRSAERLKRLISLHWPDVAESSRDNVTIVVAAKCFGCSVQDIDLVIIGNFSRPRDLPRLPGIEGKRQILSFVWTIEIKGHSSADVVFLGGKVFVPYGQFRKDVTEQAFRQKYSLLDFLRRNAKREPFCEDLIWLENYPKSELPPIQFSNVVGSDSSWNDFLLAAIGQRKEYLAKPGVSLLQAIPASVGAQYAATEEIRNLFAKPFQASQLDRKRVERLTKRIIEDQDYASRLGSQLLVFRGRGGTGKTITLIRLALDLHSSQLKRVLLLTYNVALVSDIKRSLAIIGAPRDSDGPVVQVRTVHSFMLELMKQSGLISEIDKESVDEYEKNLPDLLALTSEFRGNEAPPFDFVFIDEAQDWPTQERDIVYRIFGASRTVVADGVDQLIRSSSSTDWTARIGNTPRQVISLRKSLRLKHTLTRFSNVLAEELGLLDWSLQENADLSGGRVTVVIGKLQQAHDVVTGVISEFGMNGNDPVDSLICVPHTTRLSETSREISEMVRSCGYEVWDGTSEEQRRTFATSTNQTRLVTYESCRGLEGWTVLCFRIDSLFDRKKDEGDFTSDLLVSSDQAAFLHAARWTMIPLTRAIDHLVLHVEDPEHPIAAAVRRAARSLGSDAGVAVIEVGESSH